MVGPDRNRFEQLLYVGHNDALRLELRWHHVAIKEGDGKQVRQAVIGLFLGLDDFVHAVEAAAGKVVAELEYVRLNRNNLAGVDFVLFDQFDHAVDGGLRVDDGVVLLDGAFQDAFVALLFPINTYAPVQQVLDAIGAFDHLERSLYASTGKKQRVHQTKCRLRRGEPLPLRQRLCSHDGEGGITSSCHGDGICDLRLAQTD